MEHPGPAPREIERAIKLTYAPSIDRDEIQGRMEIAKLEN